MNWSDLPTDTFCDIKSLIPVPYDIIREDISIQKSIPLKFSNKATKQTQSGCSSYSDIVTLKLQHEPNDKVVNDDNDKKKIELNKQSNKGRNNFCYTCKPRGKVLKHIITEDKEHGVVFHYDLHKRPLILLTPIKHYHTIYDIPDKEVIDIFKSIKVFCSQWNIVDYQISYNSGEWQTHSHFHIKIKTSEKIINRLRRDHFLRIKLQQNYKP